MIEINQSLFNTIPWITQYLRNQKLVLGGDPLYQGNSYILGMILVWYLKGYIRLQLQGV